MMETTALAKGFTMGRGYFQYQNINVFADVALGSKEDNPIYFTVANICVSDEHSSGSAAYTTTDPSSAVDGFNYSN